MDTVDLGTNELLVTPSRPGGKPGDKRAGRSRLTNGGRHVRPVDRRTRAARRFNDLLDAYAAALGGSYAALPVPQVALVRLAATASLQLEVLQAEIAEGKPVDVDLVVRAGNLLSRCLTDLGLTGEALERRQAEERRRREAEEDAAIGLPPRTP